MMVVNGWQFTVYMIHDSFGQWTPNSESIPTSSYGLMVVAVVTVVAVVLLCCVELKLNMY